MCLWSLVPGAPETSQDVACRDVGSALIEASGAQDEEYCLFKVLLIILQYFLLIHDMVLVVSCRSGPLLFLFGVVGACGSHLTNISI